MHETIVMDNMQTRQLLWKIPLLAVATLVLVYVPWQWLAAGLVVSFLIGWALNYYLYVKEAKQRWAVDAKKRDAYEAHMAATEPVRAQHAADNAAYCEKHGITWWTAMKDHFGNAS